MHPWEIPAVALSLLYVVWSARQNILAWPAGLAASLIYTGIFASQRLFANAGLSLVFCVFMVYGWIQWRTAAGRPELRVGGLSMFGRIASVLTGVVLSVLIYGALRLMPDGAMPAGDAAIAGFSLVAQYLAARKKPLSWIFWIGVDALGVYVYASAGLSLTAALYGLYTILAVWGLREWLRELTPRNA